MSDLNPESLDIINAARQGEVPTENDRRRVKRAVLAGIAGASATGASSTASAAAGGTGLGIAATLSSLGGGATAVKFGVVLAVALGVTFAVEPWAEETPPTPQPTTSVRSVTTQPPQPEAREPHAVIQRAPALIAPTLEIAIEAEEAPQREESTPRETFRRRPTRTPARVLPNTPQPVPSPVQTHGPDVNAQAPAGLNAELQFLRRAQVHRTAGRGAWALRALSEHAERFPNGLMQAERDATRILVLCDLNREQEARTAARAFRAHAPNSPLRRRIEASCAAGD